MRVIRLAFFRVERGLTLAPASLRPGADEVSPFLAAHVEKLRARASSGSTAKARFTGDDDAKRVERLLTGGDEEFLQGAHELGQRLVDAMGRVSAAPGLFVAATLTGSDGQPHACALKLQVVSEQGAVLRRLESGEETLAAVTDVLDRPGELQKGLVVPDVRSSSQAVVGDKASSREAQYFLDAMGVTLELREPDSAAAVVAAVAAHTNRTTTERVVRLLPTLTPAPVPDVLRQMRDVVPGLDKATTDAIEDALAGNPRPISVVDPSGTVRGHVRAGELEISGPAVAVSEVRWERDPEGGWWVSFRVPEEPVVRYRRR